MLKKYQTLFLIVLAYITVFAFYPAIKADFINLDDFIMVVKNPNITDLSFSNLKHIFFSFYYKLYHPLVTLSYAIEYSICKLDPYLYHIDNIFLHILNTLLVFFIIKKISKNIFVAYMVAIFFAIHPIHVEVVAWISARKDTLYSFFFLLSILFYINTYDTKHATKLFFLSLISFLLSCLSKPTAITLPFVLILIDFYNDKLRLINIKRYIPFFIISLAFVYLAIIAHYSSNEIVTTKIFVRFINFLDAHLNYLFYIYKIFIPINLSCLYPKFYNSFDIIPNIIFYSTTILYMLIFVFIFSLKVNKKMFFGFFFFFITLLPSSGIMSTGVAPVADRYVYIPCIGIFFIVAELLYYIYKKNKILKFLVTSFFIIVVIPLFILTYQRNLLWTDYGTLITQAVNYSPKTAAYAYLLRGIINNNNNLIDEAEKDFLMSHSMNKYNHYNFFYLGLLKQKQNKYEEAKKYYSLIPKSSPYYVHVVMYLSKMYDEKQQDQAIELMRTTLDTYEFKFIIPDSFYYDLAKLYLKRKDFDNAIKYLDWAIKLNSSNYIFYIEKMDILLKNDNFSEFEKVALFGLKNTKNNIELLNYLIKEYFIKRNYQEAEQYSLKAISLYSNDYYAYFILGNIYAIKGSYKTALVCYTMAILLSRDNGEYYFKRAVVWYMLNNYNQAQKDIEKAEKYEFVVGNEFKQDLEKIKKEK